MKSSAQQNLNEDFGWLPGFLEAGAGNPVLALFIGGILSLLISAKVWSGQQKLAFYLRKSEEKRELYESFLTQIGLVVVFWKTWSKSKVGDWSTQEDVVRLWTIQSQIELISEDRVAEATASVVRVVDRMFSGVTDLVKSSDGVMRSKWDDISFESKNCLGVLRADISDDRRP